MLETRTAGVCARGKTRKAESTRCHHRGGPVLESALSKLTSVVGPPAPRDSRLRDSTGVAAPGLDALKNVTASDSGGRTAARRRPITDLSARVASPAVSRARRSKPARVILRSKNLKSQSTRNRYRRGPVDGGVVAKIPIRVVPPAVRGTRDRDTARMIAA
jgi:hypothetical protein